MATDWTAFVEANPHRLKGAKPQVRFATHYDTIPHVDCQDPERCDCECPGCAKVKIGPPQIVRQRMKEPNATERRFELEYLKPWLHIGQIDRYGEHESIRMDIGSGVTLCPDWPIWKDGKLSFVEVKGGFLRDDAVVKLKCFPRVYPEHPLWLYQWKGGIWIPQLMRA